jgi:hypothetical protein
MTYYALIVNDIVERVIVSSSDNLPLGEWIECRIDGSIRGCYPGPGFLYNRTPDEFQSNETPSVDPVDP